MKKYFLFFTLLFFIFLFLKKEHFKCEYKPVLSLDGLDTPLNPSLKPI